MRRMTMQKKCRRCGDKFTVKASEDYCPECEKVMTPPSAGVSKTITCECCGEVFTHTKEKPLGRWPKYCPTCANKLSKPYKKDTSKTVEDSKKTEAIHYDVEWNIKPRANQNAEKKHIEDSHKGTVQVPTAEHMDKMYGNIKHDAVNHPSHYTRGKIEVIDFIEDQQLPYHLGNVIKYIARAGYKGDKLEDLKKARWYLDRYINEVMGNGTL